LHAFLKSEEEQQFEKQLNFRKNFLRNKPVMVLWKCMVY